MDERNAGTGYLVRPDVLPAPGVLVLHPWWGLTDDVREACDHLADAGFVALAPDLFEGRTADEPAAGERLLGEADPNRLAHITRSSLHTLRTLDAVRGLPVGVVGLSMGASLALWLAARVPEQVSAVAVFYGVQDFDLAEIAAPVQGHFAEHDVHVDRDQVVLLEAELDLGGNEYEFHRYPGTSHWFAEPTRPEFDEAAAAQAWSRVHQFLASHLRRP
jgi:carboxymethylenebutenolidase